MNDVVSMLIKKAKLEDEATAGPIRMFGVHNNKIYKVWPREFNIFSLSDFVMICAERVPEEERDAPPNAYVHCYHFQGETNRAHGVPFRFLMKENEPFSETKKRLQARTQIKPKYFDKIKFALLKRNSYNAPLYLKDGKSSLRVTPTGIVLTSIDFILWDMATRDDDLLGLDHIDRSTKKGSNATDLFLK